ncbi:hypothetical protein KM043_016394 [Ampulex compressa]|nr:hypothetical protein KM043_016394 [Ampulex compressa]
METERSDRSSLGFGIRGGLMSLERACTYVEACEHAYGSPGLAASIDEVARCESYHVPRKPVYAGEPERYSPSVVGEASRYPASSGKSVAIAGLRGVNAKQPWLLLALRPVSESLDVSQE